MRLDNFKELLSKKAEGNPNLQYLIKCMREDILAEHVIESLSKMATWNTKKNPNAAIMHFGTHMDPEVEGDMIHDALSHHASQYKSALKSNNDILANAHMRKIFEIMKLSEKMTKNGLNDHSGGKLKIEAIDPKPWERSGYSKKGPNGKFSTDTKGWSRSTDDYSWMRGAPHSSYEKETKIHGHNQAYPLHEIKVNGKYLDIQDVEPTKNFIPHEFDSHPIMLHMNTSPKDHSQDKHKEYLDAYDFFNGPGGNMDKYWDKVEARGDAHYSRGQNKPEPVHAPIKSLSADDAQKRLQELRSKPVTEPAAQPVASQESNRMSTDDIKARLAELRRQSAKVMAPQEIKSRRGSDE